MTRFISSMIACFFTLIVTAQVNYSGAYGYAYKPHGNPPKEYRNEGPTGDLVLLRIENNTYKFWLDLNKGWPSYNMGEASGFITLDHDSASFDNTFEGAEGKCILHFKVSAAKVKVSTDANSFDCGFGNAVVADGNYQKQTKQPVLNNKWLRNYYSNMDTAVILSDKAVIYEDKKLEHPKKQFFVKGDVIAMVDEDDNSVYTEFISPGGKFVWGWVKKDSLKIKK